MTTWKPATPVDLHCLRCGACPDEPCRTSEGRSVPPHTERTNAFDAARTADRTPLRYVCQAEGCTYEAAERVVIKDHAAVLGHFGWTDRQGR